MTPWALIDTALTASEEAYNPAVRWSVYIEDRKTSASATITEQGGHMVLAFKGSQEKSDWRINLRAVPWRYGGAWVHMGFKQAHASVWERVRNELARRQPRPLIVTGHSLGGAMAELSCLFLQHYPNTVSLITFGKPNVFVRPESARFETLAHQLSVVSGSDMVTRLPKRHHGYAPDSGQQMLYLANSGQDYLINEMTDEHRAMIDADCKLVDGIRHHSIREYRRRINLHLEANSKVAPWLTRTKSSQA